MVAFIFANTAEALIQLILGAWLCAKEARDLASSGIFLTRISSRTVPKDVAVYGIIAFRACVFAIHGTPLAELLSRLAFPRHNSAAWEKSFVAGCLTAQTSARGANGKCIITTTGKIIGVVESVSISRGLLRVLHLQQIGKSIIVELNAGAVCAVPEEAKLAIGCHGSQDRLEHRRSDRDRIQREPHSVKHQGRKRGKRL